MRRTYKHAWTKNRAGIWVMWADRLAFSHSERIWPGIGPRPVGGPNKSPRVITPLVLRPWYRFLPRTPTLTDRASDSTATLNPLPHTSCSSSPLFFLLRAFFHLSTPLAFDIALPFLPFFFFLSFLSFCSISSMVCFFLLGYKLVEEVMCRIYETIGRREYCLIEF